MPATTTIPDRFKAGQYNSQIPHFLTNFLSKFETAIPKGAQWALFFEGLSDIVDVVLTTIKEREPGGWDINALANKIGKDEVIQTTKGCLFAQAVEIPSESIVANPEGIQMNGFLRTTTGNGRGDYSSGLRIAFLETNYSFVDTVIRPWVITTGHLGLIARPPEQQYRCNIVVCKLGAVAGPILNRNGTVKTEGTGPVILQKYTFHDACPISITGEEYNYSQATGPVIRETSFLYNYYTVSHNINI
jgi:hypothetical protein